MLRNSLCRASSQLLRGARCSAASSTASISTLSARTSSWKLAASRRPLAVAARRNYATSATSAPPDPNDNFLSGSTASYIDEIGGKILRVSMSLGRSTSRIWRVARCPSLKLSSLLLTWSQT
ncbi:hypothetical protein LB505_004967 [Fusarium chuoi]|nr:hypothetical protein LB505_004967 [Fusarium chuoi]